MKRTAWIALAGAAAALVAVRLACAQGNLVATDPQAAGPDYVVQGEYVGRIQGGARLGAQVIAEGNGAFEAVFLPGGLPGDGWDGKTRVRVKGKTEESVTRFGVAGSGWSGTIRGGRFVGQTEDGRSFSLRRVERKSPTLGMKPPAGAVVLFDGTNADEWQNGRMTPEGFLRVGTRSKRQFRDFTLHFEFRTPFMPAARGQGRGNSGLYLQDRYEIQILDSFGLEGRANECGALYGFKAPDVNMCYPPLAWQTYDVEFQAARFDENGRKVRNAIVTVRHNGVVIHDRVEIPGPSGGGRPESAEPGPFQIQDHGNPVVCRNIWVVEK